MEKIKTVWIQIENEREDYQQFKQYDNDNLQKTLSKIKKQGYIEGLSL